MMKLAILLVAGVIVRQACGDAPEAVVGGQFATEGQFSYQASLQVSKQHVCGGTIISQIHIITAAHCVDNKTEMENNMMTVVTGSIKYKEGTRHRIKAYAIHSDYSDYMNNDDIAIITLEEPIIINKFQSPIPLASQEYVTGEYYGIASGWGSTKGYGEGPASPILKWVLVYILNDEECQKTQNPLYKNRMCVLSSKGHGVCDGDSGGPLVVNGELYGVASMVSNKGCASGSTDKFTNVYRYLNFIREYQKMST